MENRDPAAMELELLRDDGGLFKGRVIELKHDPSIMGRMENPSGYGKITGTCGETMEVYLQIRGERIEQAMFFTDGCESSRRCGSAMAELCTGLSLDEAALIGGDTILMALKDLPRGEVHCAFLAAEALHAAIHYWMVR